MLTNLSTENLTWMAYAMYAYPFFFNAAIRFVKHLILLAQL